MGLPGGTVPAKLWGKIWEVPFLVENAEVEPTAPAGASAGPVYARSSFRRSSSGSLAKLTAMRRASSLVSRFAAPGGPALARNRNSRACPFLSRTMKQASFASSMVQGGGKRRAWKGR
jgi:hypothetical protein